MYIYIYSTYMFVIYVKYVYTRVIPRITQSCWCYMEMCHTCHVAKRIVAWKISDGHHGSIPVIGWLLEWCRIQQPIDKSWSVNRPLYFSPREQH